MRAPIDGWHHGWLALGALALASCTTWRVQHVAPIVLLTDARPGKVRIERTDASRVVLTHPMVVGDSIRGQQGAVAVADVTSIAVRRFDLLRTLGLVGGIWAAAAVGCVATDCLDYQVVGNLATARRIP